MKKQKYISVPSPATCSPPFEDIPGVGCVHLFPITLPWCDARGYCRLFGADLVEPYNYTALQNWFMEQPSRDGMNDWFIFRLMFRYQVIYESMIPDNNG